MWQSSYKHRVLKQWPPEEVPHTSSNPLFFFGNQCVDWAAVQSMNLRCAICQRQTTNWLLLSWENPPGCSKRGDAGRYCSSTCVAKGQHNVLIALARAEEFSREQQLAQQRQREWLEEIAVRSAALSTSHPHMGAIAQGWLRPCDFPDLATTRVNAQASGNMDLVRTLDEVELAQQQGGAPQATFTRAQYEAAMRKPTMHTFTRAQCEADLRRPTPTAEVQSILDRIEAQGNDSNITREGMWISDSRVGDLSKVGGDLSKAVVLSSRVISADWTMPGYQVHTTTDQKTPVPVPAAEPLEKKTRQGDSEDF